MRTSWCRLIAVLVVCPVLGVTLSLSRADEDERPLSEEDQARLQNVKDLVTAHQIAEFGRSYKAPEALVAAGALLLKVNAVTRSNVDKKVDFTATEKGEGGKEKGLKEQANELFDEASGLKSSKVVDALIKEAQNRDYTQYAPRDVFGGPKRISKRVDAGGLQRFTLNFVPRQAGTVALTSDRPVRFVIRSGDSTLNNSVVTSYQYTFVPRAKGGKVQIEVRGMGSPAHFTVYAH